MGQYNNGYSTLSITLELTDCGGLRNKEGRRLAGEAKTRWRAVGDHACHLYWLQKSWRYLALPGVIGRSIERHTLAVVHMARTHFWCLDQKGMRTRGVGLIAAVISTNRTQRYASSSIDSCKETYL